MSKFKPKTMTFRGYSDEYDPMYWVDGMPLESLIWEKQHEAEKNAVSDRIFEIQITLKIKEKRTRKYVKPKKRIRTKKLKPGRKRGDSARSENCVSESAADTGSAETYSVTGISAIPTDTPYDSHSPW